MERSQMGSKKMSLLLVFFILFLLYTVATSSPLDHKPFPSDSLEEHTPDHEHGTSNANDDHYAKTGIVHDSKFDHGGGFGGAHAAGGSSSLGEHGSGTPYVEGGTSVVPVYAGGAASNHHPYTHHSTSSCNQIGLLTSIFTALACLVHLSSGWKD